MIVFLDFLKYYSRFFVHFSRWGSQYWNTSVKTWRAKMTYWRIDISETDCSGKIFFSTIYSELVLNNAHTCRNGKYVLKIDKSLTILERQFYQFSNRTIFDVRHPKFLIFLHTRSIERFSFKWDQNGYRSEVEIYALKTMKFFTGHPVNEIIWILLNSVW